MCMCVCVYVCVCVCVCVCVSMRLGENGIKHSLAVNSIELPTCNILISYEIFMRIVQPTFPI